MNTIFLSKVIGIFFIITSIAYLINPHHCKKVIHDITSSYGLSAFCGSIGIILGTIIILCHNLWVNYLEIVVSLIGWLILITGLVFVFFPKSISHRAKKMHHHHGLIWINLILLLVGIFLSYMGFFHKG
jgi:hypothetical protein